MNSKRNTLTLSNAIAWEHKRDFEKVMDQDWEIYSQIEGANFKKKFGLETTNLYESTNEKLIGEGILCGSEVGYDKMYSNYTTHVPESHNYNTLRVGRTQLLQMRNVSMEETYYQSDLSVADNIVGSDLFGDRSKSKKLIELMKTMFLFENYTQTETTDINWWNKTRGNSWKSSVETKNSHDPSRNQRIEKTVGWKTIEIKLFNCSTSEAVIKHKFVMKNMPELFSPLGWLKLWTDREIDVIYDQKRQFRYVSKLFLEKGRGNIQGGFLKCRIFV